MNTDKIIKEWNEDEDFKALFFGENKSLYYTKNKLEAFLKEKLEEAYREGRKDKETELTTNALNIHTPDYQGWAKPKNE